MAYCYFVLLCFHLLIISLSHFVYFTNISNEDSPLQIASQPHCTAQGSWIQGVQSPVHTNHNIIRFFANSDGIENLRLYWGFRVFGRKNTSGFFYFDLRDKPNMNKFVNLRIFGTCCTMILILRFFKFYALHLYGKFVGDLYVLY